MPPPCLRSSKRHSDVCVCTCVTERFLPGVLVTIGSFLKAHPRFEGDLVVFHDCLPDTQKNLLRDAFNGLRFELVSPELERRCQALEEAFPDFSDRLPRFFSLEAFRLSGYRKVLYCDADLLFQGHVDALLEAPGELACCPDKVHIAGECRDAVSYLPMRRGEPSASGVIEAPFNSGILAIDGALAGSRCHDALLELVVPKTWREARVHLMDQMVLNRYFAGRQTMFDPRYNYLLASADALKTCHGLGIDAARVLHFNLRAKPWMLDQWLAMGVDEPRETLLTLPAFERWLAMYNECMRAVLLREAAAAAKGRSAVSGAAHERVRSERMATEAPTA